MTVSFIEITAESGNVVWHKMYYTELKAQQEFDKLKMIKSPLTFETYTMNLSEYPEGRIGSVRLVVYVEGERYVRRELYRKP